MKEWLPLTFTSRSMGKMTEKLSASIRSPLNVKCLEMQPISFPEDEALEKIRPETKSLDQFNIYYSL